LYLFSRLGVLLLQMSSANWNGHSSSDSSFTDHTSAAAAVVVSSTTTGKESIMQAGIAELQTLLEIENDPILKLQLRNWEEQAASISRRIERKENRTYVVKNEIYQVLGFYIVFQGVVLTAVAQASALQCSQWWSPFTLSLIASIVTIVGVYQKLQVLHDVEQNLREERNSFQVLAA
jgi:glutamate-1-semialdehyde aminotransferase